MPPTPSSPKARPLRGLYADEPRPLDACKPLKVALPVRHHLLLHTARVVHGQGLSETVSAALDLYFEALDRRRAGRAAAQLSGVRSTSSASSVG